MIVKKRMTTSVTSLKKQTFDSTNLNFVSPLYYLTFNKFVFLFYYLECLDEPFLFLPALKKLLFRLLESFMFLLRLSRDHERNAPVFIEACTKNRSHVCIKAQLTLLMVKHPWFQTIHPSSQS